MSIIKRFLYLGVLFAVLPVMAMAQTGSQEMTVEQSYLQESVEMIIIREQSRSNSRDNKLVALQYIKSAIDRGSTSDEIQVTLDYLSLEGLLYITRENGRVVNNFPDIRRQAATYLGELGTPEAKNTLMKIVNSDNEPMVLSEAIRALGTIGNNDDNQVTNIISWTVRRFDILVPDNYLALSALDAFEKIATANKGLTDPLAYETIMNISQNYNYISPVRNRASELLNNLLRGNFNN